MSRSNKLQTTEQRIEKAKEEDPAVRFGLSHREVKFFELYAKSSNLSKAAIKAFGSSKLSKHNNPTKYAKGLLQTTGYDSAVIEYFCNIYGMTDAHLIRKLSEGFHAMEWDSKADRKPLISIINTVFKLKKRTEIQERPQSLTINNNNQSSTTHNTQLQAIVATARKEMGDDQIAELLTGTAEAFKNPPETKPHTEESLFNEGDNTTQTYTQEETADDGQTD